MKTKKIFFVIAFAIFCTSLVQAKTNFNSPPNSKNEKESHTLTFEQNSLDKKITSN